MFTALHDVDVAAFLLIQQLPHPAWVIGLMWVFSLAGTAGCVWVVTATIIAIRNHDFGGLWRVLLAITFVIGIVDVGLKPLIDRDRPYEHTQTAASSMRAIPSTSSFPSGHAATSAAGAYAVARLAPAATTFVWPMALAITFSRIYLGVPYPLAVIAGWLIGLAASVFVTGGVSYGKRMTR